MSHCRALVFDFDGLILDTETPLFESWKDIYREAGVTISVDYWASILGTSADPQEGYEILEQHLGHPIDRDALHERRMRREMELLKGETVLPGVVDMLRSGKRAGLSLAIASSSDRKWVTGHIDSLGLRSYFETVVCADDVAHTKPAPDLYRLAVERLGVSPSQAIAFEDSAHGVRAAVRAGLYCVAVPNRITQELDFGEADRIVDSLEACDLEELLSAADGKARSTSTGPH